MAPSKEQETQKLILLGAISQLEEAEREEIFALKDKYLGVLKTATKREFGVSALMLAGLDVMKDD